MIVANDCIMCLHSMPLYGGDECAWYCTLLDIMCVLEGLNECGEYNE